MNQFQLYMNASGSSTGGPRALSSSELKAGSTNAGYKDAKTQANRYLETISGYPNKIDECTVEQIANMDFFQGFARFMVEDLTRLDKPDEKYAPGSCLQFFSGIKMWVKKKFPNAALFNPVNKDDVDLLFEETTSYIDREMTQATWKEGADKQARGSPIGRDQIRWMCEMLLKKMGTSSFKMCASNRAGIAFTWAFVGRAGEAANQSWGSASLNAETSVIDTVNKESKLSEEKDSCLVPDVCLEMCCYHCLAVYYMQPEYTNDQRKSRLMFPEWNDLKYPGQRTNRVIKELSKLNGASQIGLSRQH